MPVAIVDYMSTRMATQGEGGGVDVDRTVAGLDKLLEAARRATREDRIKLRNPIAEYGTAVIPTMSQWMAEPAWGVRRPSP